MSGPSRRRGRSSLAFRLGASAVVLVAFLFLAEGVSRFLGPEIPAWRALDAPGTLLVGHDTRLWGMAAGRNSNGTGEATVDPIGLRAPIPTLPRPAGRQRVLVVGDSTIFGHGVPDDQTLPVHLGAALRARGVDVDVANGGIPGYSSEQTKLLLDEVGWSLEPTLLVVANMWSDNNFDLWRDADLLHTSRVFAGNPLRRSAFYTLMASTIDRLRGGSGARIVTWTRASGVPAGEVVRRVPLHDYAANLDDMARQAAERGVGVAFLGLANRDLVLSTWDEGSWDAYIQAQAEVAAHHGVVRVDAVEPLQAAQAAGTDLDALFVDELHPSGRGHEVIAGALAAALVEAGWPETPMQADAARPYDPSGLYDAWTTQAEGGGGRGSPQRLLISAEETPPASAGEAGVRDPGQPTPTPHPGPASAPAPSATATASGVAPWWVEGTVRRESGGDGPVLVEVRSGDRVLSSARLRRPGDFRLRVRGEVDAVEVVASDAGGDADPVRADATRSDAPLALVLP